MRGRTWKEGDGGERMENKGGRTGKYEEGQGITKDREGQERRGKGAGRERRGNKGKEREGKRRIEKEGKGGKGGGGSGSRGGRGCKKGVNKKSQARPLRPTLFVCMLQGVKNNAVGNIKMYRKDPPFYKLYQS